MEEFRIAFLESALGDVFDERERKDVLTWLIANDQRKIVAFIGAGFSRNAKRTGNQMVPLWPELMEAWRRDLCLEPDSTYDSMELAQFVVERLGADHFVNDLKRRMDDTGLQPGEAHRALAAASDIEAIVTTNQLDTLLDRATGRDPVVYDSGLSQKNPNRKALTYYIHGHRSNHETWVFTRNDFQDVEPSRPLLFAKVRQLFAEHPILVMGHSLTDSDFQRAYRAVSVGMLGHQPLGLMISVAKVQDVEYNHWSKVGLLCVAIKGDDKLSIDQRLAKFISLPKVLRLNKKEYFKFLKAWISGAPKVDVAIKRCLDILAFHESELGAEEQKKGLWRAVLAHPMLNERKVDASNDGVAASPRYSTSSRGNPADDTQFLADDSSETSKCRRMFGICASKWALQWLKVGIVSGFTFELRARGAVDIILSSVAAFERDNKVQEKDRSRHLDAHTVTPIIREVYAFEKLWDEREAGKIRDAYLLEIQAWGKEWKETSLDSVTDYYDLNHDFVRHMRISDQAMAEARYRDAADAAQNARHAAGEVEDFLGEWLASVARRDALAMLGGRHFPSRIEDEEEEKELEAARKDVEAAESNPALLLWSATADARSSALNRETIERFVEERARNESGARTTRFSDTYRRAWTTVRELQRRYSPLSVLHKYLRPLIDSEETPFKEELQYRLDFSASGAMTTEEWLRRIGNKIMPPDERLAIGYELTRVLFAETGTNQRRLRARLKVATFVEGFIRKSALSDLEKWTRETTAAVAQWGHKRASHETARLIAGVWTLYLELAFDLHSLQAVYEFVSAKEDTLIREELLSHLSSLPLSEWAENTDEKSQLIRLFLLAHPSDRKAESVAWGLATLCEGGATVDTEQLRSFAKRLFEAELKKNRSEGRLNAALMILRHTKSDEFVDKSYDILTRVRSFCDVDVAERSAFQILRAASLTIGLLEAEALVGRVALPMVLAAVDSNWARVLKAVQDNEQHARSLAWVLGEGLRSESPSEQSKLRLLELLRTVPNALIHELASVEIWGDKRTAFISVLRAHFRSVDTADVSAALRFAYDLFSTGKPLPPDLDFLILESIVQSRDSRPAIANLASFNVVLATRHPSEHQKALGEALDTIRVDLRQWVQVAAGFAAGYLGDDFEAERARLDTWVTESDSALLDRQRRVGAAARRRAS